MTDTLHEIAPEEIMAHHDGELSPDRAKQVSAHLEFCAECRNLAESFHATSQSLSTWRISDVPNSSQTDPNLSSLLDSKLRSHCSLSFWQQLRRHRIASAVATAFGVIVLAMLGITYVRYSSLQTYTNKAQATVSLKRETGGLLGGGRGGGGGGGRPSDQQYHQWLAEGAKGDRVASSSTPTAPPPLLMQPQIQQKADMDVLQTPMIARTAELQIVAAKFDAARAAVESVLARHHGYAASLSVGDAENTARTLNASLRIPSQELPAALGELKAIGHVTSESQAGEEVTAEHADLVARLKNSRESEARLQDILRTRTGKVSDVLEVEQEMARVRGEIEQMESELKTLDHRVDFATVTLAISEEYKAKVSDSTPSIATRFHNALVAGYENVSNSALDLLFWFAEYLPLIIFWLAILVAAIIIVWRIRRRAVVAADASPWV